MALFETDHWLSNPLNCKVLHLPAPVWGAEEAPAPSLSAADKLALWTCQELRDYLTAHDLAGLATHLHGQSVNGKDFLDLSETELVEDLRCTPFAARKLVAARAKYLA